VSKEDAQEEKSTVDSPLKENFEGHHQSSPSIERTNPVDGDSNADDTIVVEHGPIAKN
jgi:hypothetical protein